MNYILYKLVPRENGKTDKVPVSLEGLPADSQNPANWLSLTDASTYAQLLGRGYGVGIVITPESKLFALDLDRAHDGTAWASYVQPILDAFPGAYTEVSVSGRGLHVIASYSGARPLHGTRCHEMLAELYTGGRFIALGRPFGAGSMQTDHSAALAWLLQWFPQRGEAGHGDDWTDTPVPGYGIADDVQLVDRARRSTSVRAMFGGGISFAQLWDGDLDALARAFPPQTAGQNHDASAADLALCNHLCFWSGGNCEQVARLLRASGLARPKHERYDGYIVPTVLRACAGQTQWYSDRAAVSPPSAAVAGGPPGPSVSTAGAIATVAAVTSEPGALAAPAVAHVITFDRQGRVESTLANLAHLIREGNAGRVRYDTFTDQIIVGDEPLTDDAITRIRIAFELMRVAPPSKDNVRDAIERIARDNTYDSAQDWLNAQTWDGVPRIATFMSTYCGTEDTDYARAVGLYLWSGLAARVMAPGCQVDMVPVLVGPQGLRKSSAVAALAPHPDYFTEVPLNEKDADLARKMRGKVVGEIADMQGLTTRDANAIKAFVTTRNDKWVPKFKEFSTTAGRRLVFIGTSNPARFLDDETGERRWLPITVLRSCDVESIARDRGQLWAEGAAYWLTHGVAWQGAELLARAEHVEYKVSDPWEQAIAAWVSVAGRERFTVAELLTGSLSIAARDMSRTEQNRAAKILRQLGYANTRMVLGGERCWRWTRLAPL